MRGKYEERSPVHAYAASPDLHRIFGSQKSAAQFGSVSPGRAVRTDSAEHADQILLSGLNRYRRWLISEMRLGNQSDAARLNLSVADPANDSTPAAR